MSKLIIFLLGLVLLFGCQTMPVFGASIDTSSLTSASSLPKGYKLVPAVVVGEVDGIPFNLTGPANSILAQLEKKHPNVDFSARAAESMNGTAATDYSLAKQKKNQLRSLCMPVAGWGWGNACYGDAEDAARMIERTPGSTFVRSRTCVVAACVDTVEVVICSDRDDDITVGNHYLATYPRRTCNECYITRGGVDSCWKYCGGQLFDTDNYNVITRRKNGNC